MDSRVLDVLDEILAAIEGGGGGGAPAWEAYTPTFSAEDTPLSLGDGTVLGEYVRWSNDLVQFRAKLTQGTTTTYGEGALAVTLPSLPAAGWGNSAVGVWEFGEGNSPYITGESALSGDLAGVWLSMGDGGRLDGETAATYLSSEGATLIVAGAYRAVAA